MRKTTVFLRFLLLFFIIAVVCRFDVSAKEYEISNYDVEMSLSAEGDFLVEERISFHFLSGDFSYAYREIEGNIFKDIEFIGLEGINTSISDYELSGGKDLNIKWYYNYIGDTATFIFQYKGIAGLQSIDGQNVIDWTPTGAEWDVPIRDIDIYINFPWELDNFEVRPSEDINFQDFQGVHFHNELLAPGKEYVVYLSFPEMVTMAEKKEDSLDSTWEKKDIILFLAVLLTGLLLTVFDLLSINKLNPEKGKYSINELLLYEKAAIFSNTNDTRKGLTAQVFSLAQRGKIKLISSIKKGLLGTKEAEISVEILNTDNLDSIEKGIINNLKKHKTLKEFSQDYKWFSQMSKDIKNELRKKGFISPEREQMRKRIYTSSLLFLIPSIALIIMGGLYNKPLLIGTAIGLFLITIGRLIKGASINILTAEALYLKQGITEELDEKKKALEKLVKSGDGTAALDYFFSQIGYIILQKYFGSGVLAGYKKAFKKAEKVELPGWLEMDISELGSTLDALEIVELIDYMMLSMIIVAANTGTTTVHGTGGGGGTAGGGGGGAG